MNTVIMLCLSMVCFAGAESKTKGPSVEEAMADVEYLASKFIEINNLRQGIEFLGGPFEFKNYTRSIVEKKTNELDKGLSISWRINTKSRTASFPIRFIL